MKCSFCDSEAIYNVGRTYYCEKHFIEYFENKAISTIKKYNLISKGDKIGVAVSGGKDSISLAYFLKKYSKEFGIKITIIHIDEGIEGYRNILTEYLKKFAEKNNIPLKIFSFKESFGYTLDEALRILKNTPIKPCTICGIWRRWIMNKAAKELGVSKIATAHNMNDEVQTIFLNVLEGNFADYIRGGPYVGIKYFEGFVPRVKPFYFHTEKETMIYALLNNIRAPFAECPYIVGQIRHIIRKKLYHVENQIPGFHERIIINYLKKLRKVREKLSEVRHIKRCKICGEPTSREICRACELKKILEEKS